MSTILVWYLYGKGAKRGAVNAKRFPRLNFTTLRSAPSRTAKGNIRHPADISLAIALSELHPFSFRVLVTRYSTRLNARPTGPHRAPLTRHRPPAWRNPQSLRVALIGSKNAAPFALERKPQDEYR